jgi:hypothetical protein
MFPIYAALSGSFRGLDLATMMASLGRERCTHRVRAGESHG